MKRDRQSVNLRHAEMLSMIRERQEIRVEELAKAFSVSLMTVRRDLQLLAEKGKISRTHGGATVDYYTGPVSEEDDVELYRDLIAQYASSLVSNGDHIFINGSGTALSLLNYLGGKRVQVFTNNGAAVGVKYPAGVEVSLLGGVLRGSHHIMTGDGTIRNLLSAQADKAFLGCTGISPDGEILCGIPAELGINETMIGHAEEYFILADHTKIGKTSTYASCHLEKSGCVITDERAPADVLEQLRAIGMRVIQVHRSDFPETEQKDNAPLAACNDAL